jgi:hypothetical protein
VTNPRRLEIAPTLARTLARAALATALVTAAAGCTRLASGTAMAADAGTTALVATPPADCAPSQLRCEDGAGGSYCASVVSDNANCGGCGVHCAAGQVCSGGACATDCQPDERLCGDAAGGGACVSLADDPDNCGACGAVCPAAANAVAVCADSRCATVCQAGFADCDGDAANGCEVATQTSVDDCGACGQACPSPANGVAVCSDGTCGAVCSEGWASCGGAACGVELASDPENCGACGHACDATQLCQSGACVVPSFTVGDGPLWTAAPPTYSCQETCALLFGGADGDWSCSTTLDAITHTAWVSGFASGAYCASGGSAAAESFKSGTTYGPGAASAYVHDWCSGDRNYCFRN